MGLVGARDAPTPHPLPRRQGNDFPLTPRRLRGCLHHGAEHAGPDPDVPGRTADASERTTFLLSAPPTARFPNGASRNAAVSHDQRIARFIAYESDASNIVDGDTNNTTDVFLVIRARPVGPQRHAVEDRAAPTSSRTAWAARRPTGRSYAPALDGDSHHAPHCVAFVSAASNLVAGRHQRPARRLRLRPRSRHDHARVGGLHGAQANGSTYDVSIDGDCERVAFTSDATNLALTKAPRRAWKARDQRAARHQAGLRARAERRRATTRGSRA